MIKPLVTSLLLALAGSPCFAEQPNVIRIAHDTLTDLTVTGEIGTILVANPAVADVAPVDSRRLVVIGRKPGSTGLLILSKTGERLVETTVLVVPEPGWTVRVNRGAKQTTLTCAPDCVPVETTGPGAATVQPAKP